MQDYPAYCFVLFDVHSILKALNSTGHDMNGCCNSVREIHNRRYSCKCNKTINSRK